jgi:hypothetical protein
LIPQVIQSPGKGLGQIRRLPERKHRSAACHGR